MHIYIYIYITTLRQLHNTDNTAMLGPQTQHKGTVY